MKKRTIMICLEKMGIGGVETAILNQIMALRKKNIDVIVVGKEGIYVEKVLDLGAKFIDFEYPIDTVLHTDILNKLKKIIADNNVDEIHVNQIPCYPYVFLACADQGIPYVAYMHFGNSAYATEDDNNVFNWYEKKYPIYKNLFKVFYANASKIVSITKKLKGYVVNRYGINEDKIRVIPNSIDFDKFKDIKPITNSKNILIISRLEKEKKKALFESLELYKALKLKDDNFNLVIAGDGVLKQDIEIYLKENNLEAKFLGQINDVYSALQDIEIVFGQGRCILETIAARRLAIMVADSGVKGIVNSKNLNSYIENNFAYFALENADIGKVVKTILDYDLSDIKKITNDNYDIAIDHLDINKNIVLADKYSINNEDITSIVCEYVNILNEKICELNNKIEFIVDQNENIIKEKDTKIDELNYTLHSIYGSRTYKISKKVSNAFKRRK